MDKLPAQPIKGLIDGLAVIEALAMSTGKVSGTKLSKELGLELTRVNRILKTLASLGLAHRTRDRKYLPGSGMHVLAAHAVFGSGLISSAMKHLEPLSDTNLIVAMGVLWQDQVSYIYNHTPGSSPADALGKTTLYPATKSGIGMALLARMKPAEVRNIYRGKDIPGFKTMKELIAALKATHERGYADVTNGYRSIAVPVGSPAFSAVTLSGKIINKQIPSLVERLNITALQISKDVYRAK